MSIILALLVAAAHIVGVVPVSFNITMGSVTPFFGISIAPNSSVSIYCMPNETLFLLTNSSVVIPGNGSSLHINWSAYVPCNGVIKIINPSSRDTAYIFYMIQPGDGIYDPIGIADYGLLIYPGWPVMAYDYSTDEVLGVAYVKSLRAIDTSTLCGVKVGDSYVDLQLNAVAESGNGQYYLLQDVLVFNGTYGEVLDNVWNITSRNGSLIGVYGYGSVSSYEGRAYYYYSIDLGPLVTPFNMTLAIRTIDSYGSSMVMFGYGLGDSFRWFDYVTIPSPGLRIVVNGSSYLRFNVPADVEFVLTGPVCGIAAIAKDVDVELSLSYVEGNSTQPVPYAWGIGTMTSEALSNASARPLGFGKVNVSSLGLTYPGPVYMSYLVKVSTLNGTVYYLVPPGYTINITLHTITLGNGTAIRPLGFIVNGSFINGSTMMVTINGATTIGEAYASFYRVVVVNGSEIHVMWVRPGSLLVLKAPRYVGFRMLKGFLINNSTLYSSASLNITVNEPLFIVVLWENGAAESRYASVVSLALSFTVLATSLMMLYIANSLYRR